MKEELERGFKAPGDSPRLRILELLKKTGNSVCAISDPMDILCSAGRVLSEKILRLSQALARSV
jgi:hypothetical protein